MKETPYLCGGEFFALLISTFKYIFMKANHVCGKIYHIGVNDRRKPLFENMWPLPGGVAYNSYLIADQKGSLGRNKKHIGSLSTCYGGWK